VTYQSNGLVLSTSASNSSRCLWKRETGYLKSLSTFEGLKGHSPVPRQEPRNIAYFEAF